MRAPILLPLKAKAGKGKNEGTSDARGHQVDGTDALEAQDAAIPGVQGLAPEAQDAAIPDAHEAQDAAIPEAHEVAAVQLRPGADVTAAGPEHAAATVTLPLVATAMAAPSRPRPALRRLPRARSRSW
jgi:hypothetical protein